MNKITNFLCLSLLLLGATALGMDNPEKQLIWAVVDGKFGKVKELIAQDLSVEMKDVYGSTLLLLAAVNGHMHISELLIARGASVEARNPMGHTPLSWAAWNRQEGVCKLLIDLELKRERKYRAVKAAMATFLGIVRKRRENLPCQMQKDIAQLIARQALATVRKSKRSVTEQINDIANPENQAKWLAYANEQMNAVNK